MENRFLSKIPLPAAVAVGLYRTGPDPVRASVVATRWLDAETTVGLSALRLTAPTARDLLSRTLPPEAIDAIVVDQGERRASVLRALLVHNRLSGPAAAALAASKLTGQTLLRITRFHWHPPNELLAAIADRGSADDAWRFLVRNAYGVSAEAAVRHLRGVWDRLPGTPTCVVAIAGICSEVDGLADALAAELEAPSVVHRAARLSARRDPAVAEEIVTTEDKALRAICYLDADVDPDVRRRAGRLLYPKGGPLGSPGRPGHSAAWHLTAWPAACSVAAAWVAASVRRGATPASTGYSYARFAYSNRDRDTLVGRPLEYESPRTYLAEREKDDRVDVAAPLRLEAARVPLGTSLLLEEALGTDTGLWRLAGELAETGDASVREVLTTIRSAAA